MEWDESKHPRDKIGRFTSSGLTIEEAKNMSVEQLKQRLIQSTKVPLDFFSKKEKQIRKYNSDTVPDIPREAYGFVRLYTEHHQQHADEMGYKNQKEYEQAAIKFWNAGEGTIYYSKPRNSFYKYNEKTTELIIVSEGGMIHSFMYRTKNKFINTRRWDELERYDKI